MALLELQVMLFYKTLLRKKQDRIVMAMMCCEEALQTRHEVIPNTGDCPDLVHLFTTLVGYMPRLGATATR